MNTEAKMNDYALFLRPLLFPLALLWALLPPGSVGAQPSPFVESKVQVLHGHAAENPGDNFGWVAEAVGDLDGDGASEYVIGAIRNADGGPLAGKAYVYSGADGSLLNTVVGGPRERLGFSVGGGGDADADGVPDYAIGAPGVGGNGARVIILSGADHSVLFEVADGPLTFLGFDLAFTGDVNGDGHDDLVVGAPLDGASAPFAGRIDVVSGLDGSILWSQAGLQAGANLGTSVTGLADLDGDSVLEVAAGAVGVQKPIGQQQTRGGVAYVFDGATGAYVRTLRPNGTAASFGVFFIHDAGDVDADGWTDVFVGDVGDVAGGAGSGRAYVFSGRWAQSGDGEPRLRLINAENAGDGMGIGRGAGDLDGDGHADLVVGAYLNSEGVFQGGKCYLVSGKNGRALRTFTLTVNNGQLGFDVVQLGDVNDDGLTDFLLTGLDLAYVVAGTP